MKPVPTYPLRAVIQLMLIASASAFASAAQASKPDWAKPYLKGEVPSGSYIADNDQWVIVHGEIVFSLQPSGALERTYRFVLAPTAGGTRRLTLAIPYDEALQTLIEPEVLVPGTFSYRTVNLKKAAVDAPDASGATITADRNLFITTQEIPAPQRAVATWKIIDKDRAFCQDLLYACQQFPAAEMSFSLADASGSSPLEINGIRPLPNGNHDIQKGPLLLRGIPARSRAWDWGDEWLPDPTHGLPTILVQAAADSEQGWKGRAAQARAVLWPASTPKDREAVASVARSVASGAKSQWEKAAKIAGFVQNITYRNEAWGKGAYTPAAPSETLRSMSADCKGKVALLQSLMQEIGVESVPLLCRAGGAYLGTLPCPSTARFDHVVLALKVPGAKTMPGAMKEPPFRDYILFDPTDSLAVLGLPPNGLEGKPALWIAPPSEGLITIQTREIATERARARLAVMLNSMEAARFILQLEGGGGLLGEVIASRLHMSGSGQVAERCRSLLNSAAPGIVIEKAAVFPPDHESQMPARMELEGIIPKPSSAAGERWATLSSPASIIGLCLAIPSQGYRREAKENAKDHVERPPEWLIKPNYQATWTSGAAQISLSLPAGWGVAAAPGLDSAIDKPWLKAAASGGTTWALSFEMPRGGFSHEAVQERLSDLNQLAALLRKPFLLELKDGPVNENKSAY